jgi:hypothetical protein
MTADTSALFDKAMVSMGSALTTWTSGTAATKWVLLGSSTLLTNCGTNKTGWSTYADITTDTHEIAHGTYASYITGGQVAPSLTAPALASSVCYFDMGDISWTSATMAGVRVGIIKGDSATITTATGPLIGYWAFGADQSVTAGTFTVVWASSPQNGCFAITISGAT